MEEVSLNDDATQAPYELEELELSRRVGKEGGEENNNAWLEAYKKLMNKSIQTFYSLLGSKAWKPILNTFIDSKLSSSLYPVFLFECDRNAAHGFYTLKAQAILNVRPERLMYVIRDHNPDTRLAWDSEYVKECKELDCYQTTEGEIKVVSTRVSMGGIPMLSDRFNMGITWYGYDDKTESYKYVFRSTQHKLHKCPSGAVNVISLMGVFVKTLIQNEESASSLGLLESDNRLSRRISELFIVVHVNPGNSFPSTIANGFCKEWLRDRVRLYEKVAGEGWKKYYQQPRKK